MLLVNIVHSYVVSIRDHKPRTNSSGKSYGHVPRSENEDCSPSPIDGSAPPSPMDIDERCSFESVRPAGTDGDNRVIEKEPFSILIDSKQPSYKLSLREAKKARSSKGEHTKFPTPSAPPGSTPKHVSMKVKPLETPDTARGRRRVINANDGTVGPSLGSTLTPAGVRKSARIRACRLQS
jgi:hypothetical protein